MTPARILTVCTGNVCRSPFLERALQTDLERSWGVGAVEVSSAGTGALAGHPMEEQARVLLEGQGYAADRFVARHLTAASVAEADLVLTATRAHRGKVAMLHPKALRYVFAFREFAELVSGVPPERLSVPGESARDHVVRVVALAAAQRGARAPLSDEEADIVDPYGRGPDVFDRMSAQIMRSLPAVTRALGRS
ncbi:arsenate reductase/protein-tyrosine-phosphatase family protein [Pedococcus sp. 5OH_020]|uniref:arsenate reductase/protein-tyrosine-phosphatase family protein n=1 Tax=Pedococcus sp. 5OH_020 TaxID=2989814 RepID=UPI0022E9B2D6|nr:low molecular weight phosphatase family protein [Pedococcus sp. 5OH_020]